jgi:hypothetical protein
MYLKLDKAGVAELPTVPLKRWYRELFDKWVHVCRVFEQKNRRGSQA